MSDAVHIALDAMGGDNAPQIVLAGANIARQRYQGVRFHLFGDTEVLTPLIAKLRGLGDFVEVHHTSEIVGADEKPFQAVRRRGTSMRLAIEAVKEGRAAGIVSAGNTGALMGLAVLTLRTLSGINRPAIASYFPTMRGEAVLLDSGANVTCDSANLVQFAVMGEVFARTVFGTVEPTIGLLNIGSESGKGNEVLRRAASVLRDAALPIKFHGFVEGDDIAMGTVDVIVTDGFSGNIALKMAEGTAKLIMTYFREAFRSSAVAGIGYFFARRALDKLMIRTDPRRYNGAMLVGLNGIVVKSHGAADALGFATAIGVAYDMLRHGFNDTLAGELSRLDPPPENPAPPTGVELEKVVQGAGKAAP